MDSNKKQNPKGEVVLVVVREGREKLFNLGFIETEMLMEYTSGGNQQAIARGIYKSRSPQRKLS